MTDQEILDFCGFKPTDPPEAVQKFINELTPAKREVMEKMRQIEMWDASDGLVPLPDGVLIDRAKDRHMRRYIDKI
jgi:hypothetical protein